MGEEKKERMGAIKVLYFNMIIHNVFLFSTKDDDLEMKQLSTEHFFNKNSQEIDLKTATKQRSNYTLLTAGLFDQTYCRILNIHLILSIL